MKKLFTVQILYNDRTSQVVDVHAWLKYVLNIFCVVFKYPNMCNLHVLFRLKSEVYKSATTIKQWWMRFHFIFVEQKIIHWGKPFNVVENARKNTCHLFAVRIDISLLRVPADGRLLGKPHIHPMGRYPEDRNPNQNTCQILLINKHADRCRVEYLVDSLWFWIYILFLGVTWRD